MNWNHNQTQNQNNLKTRAKNQILKYMEQFAKIVTIQI